MILPTKRLGDRALIRIGADVLRLLTEAKTVSRVWTEFKALPTYEDLSSAVTYDWFVLALDLLFLMGAITLEGGRLSRPSE